MSSRNMPKEFLQIIAKEMVKMLNRQLENSPSADEIDFPIEIMAGDLYSRGYEVKDEKRIVDAFNFFGSWTKKWPKPSDIIEALKSRHSQTVNPYQKRIAPIKETDEAKAKRTERGEVALAKLKKIAKSGKDHFAKQPLDITRDMEMQRREDEHLALLHKHYEEQA